MSEAGPTDIIVGIDTHKHTHTAVAITRLGARLGELTIRVGSEGYRELDAWARSLGPVHAFGIEGTGSYGAGLARFLRQAGHAVHEVSRPDRGQRRRQGKTDHLDAEAAARAVLGGQATALPKSGTSEVEMIRHLKVTRDTAVKARTQAGTIGISVCGGHDGTKGVPPWPDAKSLGSLTRYWTSCWRARTPERPSTRVACWMSSRRPSPSGR